MNAIRQAVDEIDPSIFIYGEGWSAGSCALPNGLLGMKANIPQMPRIAAFSDEIRDALRGPFSDDTKPGWLGGAPDCKESLKFGIVGGIRHPQVDMKKVNYSKEPWAMEPTQMISYVSCHDDMCLVDRLKASIPDITDEELIRLDLLAQTAVFTSHLPCEKQENNQQEGGARKQGLVLQRTGWVARNSGQSDSCSSLSFYIVVIFRHMFCTFKTETKR